MNWILELDEKPKQSKNLMIDVNCVYTKMECVMLQEEVPTKFGFVQLQHVLKAKFDVTVFNWLSSKIILREEIENTLCRSRTLCSKNNSTKIR